MQEALNDLETRLDKLFGKGSPYQMSDKNKRALAGASWAIALVIGILQAWAALALWQLGHVANAAITYSNYVASTYGNGAAAPQLGLFFYISLLTVAVDAVLLLMAVPALKEFRKHGWDLLYYSLLLNVIYGFLRSFSNVGGGLGQFIVQLFFSAVVGYFLFQVRGVFVAGKSKEIASGPHSGSAHAEHHAEQHHETDK
jgi:hypothetical protein